MLAAIRDNGNGVLEASIDPNNSPLFIKIPRRRDSDAKDSQRRVTVYKRVSYGMRQGSAGTWVHYPIYVEVQQKGNLIRGNYLITEYGREDSPIKDYGPNVEGLKKMFALGDFISRNVIEDYKIKYTNSFSQMIEDMNYQYLLENKFHGDTLKLVNALNKQEKGEQEETEIVPFNKTTAEFYSGAAKGSDTEWANVAKEFGIDVKNYTGTDYRNLSNEWKAKIEEEYKEARKFLGKPVLSIKNINDDYDPGVLTRRDMMQADKADAIFAIAERIVKNGQVEVSNGREYTNNTGHDNVQGGTANAVARGIIRGIPVYVYDQSDNQWKVWSQESEEFVATQTPSLTSHAATIGTRQINNAGKQAIKDVFNNSLAKPVEESLPKEANATISEGLTQEQIDELKKEAEDIKKQCKGE